MQLNLLGPMELRVAGQAVTIGPPKQRAVLALLAMHADRVVPVDTIVDRLWAGNPPANATGNLQAYVSNLRRALEPDRQGRPRVLVSAADGYGLMTPSLSLDVREMESGLHTARELSAARSPREAVETYDAALALWRGDTFADVRTEEWAQPEIARLEELRSNAVEERAALLLELDRPADAVASLEAMTHAQPLRERAWELLALAYVRSGRQADALAALRRVREVLAEELGLDPGPRLQELEGAILRQEVPLATPRTPRVRRSPDRPFVGRTHELETLRRLFTETGPVVALVEGEPGVGKSRLVERLVDECTATVPAYLGRSPDHETAPALWPWEQLLGRLVADRPDLPVPEALAAFLDRTTAAAPSYDVQGARLRLFDDVAGYLAAAAPLLVVLEDLHAADQATLGLLEHLAESDAHGVVLVATLRRHETLTGVLARLARHGARRMPLEGLSTPEVRSLVEAVTGDDPGEPRAGSLRARTAGNPFFITELARAGGPVPAAVRDVVLDRVTSLGEVPRAVLEAAAVVGDRAEAWLVAEVSTLRLADVVEALDRAQAAGMVRPTEQGYGVRFTHALVVDALLGARSPLWRAAAHERCAAALTRTRGHLEEHHGDIARHWLAAAELGPEQARAASEFCSRAARSAMSRNAPEDALAFWQEAVAAGLMAGATAPELFEPRLGLTEALYASGRFDDGYAAAVEALAVSGDDPERVVRTADVCMAHGVWIPFTYGTDPVELRVALERAVGALPPGSASWALGQACRAVVLAAIGEEAGVVPATSAALEAAEGSGEPALLRRVLHLRLVAMRGPAFVSDRAETARLLRALPDLPPTLEVIADLHLASHLVELGQVDRGERRLAGLETRAQQTRNPTLIRQVLSMRVGLEIFTGRYDDALARLDSVEAATTTVDAGYFQAGELGQRVFIAAEQGRLADLLGLLEEVYAQTGIAGFGYALGLSLVAAGRADEAAELLAVPLPPRDFTWVTAIMLRLQLAVAVDALDTVRECHSLLRPFSGQFVVNGACTSVHGPWDLHLGEASLALGDLPDARRELASAVAALDGLTAPYWQERGRQALAKCS